MHSPGLYHDKNLHTFLSQNFAFTMYIYLVSNGSKTFFPENKESSFRIKMPRPLILEGAWEIGLIQLTLPAFTNTYTAEYVDITTSSCNQSISNDTEKQILNRIFLAEIPETKTMRFQNPHYISVNTSHIYVLDINLYDDEGKRPSFARGQSYCTLHLRKSLQ